MLLPGKVSHKMTTLQQGGSYFVVLQHIAFTEDHNLHNYSTVFGIYETVEAARAAMKVWSIDVDRYGFAKRSPVEDGAEPRYLEGTIRNGFNEAVGDGYRLRDAGCVKTIWCREVKLTRWDMRDAEESGVADSDGYLLELFPELAKFERSIYD